MRLLFTFLSCLFFCGCGYEFVKKDNVSESSTCSKSNPKEFNAPKVITKTNFEVVSDFNKHMSWYHEEINYDQTKTQVMPAGSNTYSVKYLQKRRRLEYLGQKEGEKCNGCNGTGKSSPIGFPNNRDCFYCKGDGRIDLIKWEESKIATITYDPNTNETSLSALEP